MDFQANLTVGISRQGNRYVAFSPALDISTSGKTEAEVKDRFVELVNIFVEELEAAGTTVEVLSELGWHKESNKNARSAWIPPTYKTEEVSVRIPIAV